MHRHSACSEIKIFIVSIELQVIFIIGGDNKSTSQSASQSITEMKRETQNVLAEVICQIIPLRRTLRTKRSEKYARQARQTTAAAAAPLLAPPPPPPPTLPPHYPVQVLQPCLESSLPVVQYEVGPHYVTSDFSVATGQQHYDFSVSDSDRLVRALGLDFSDSSPVQRELSAK